MALALQLPKVRLLDGVALAELCLVTIGVLDEVVDQDLAALLPWC